MIVKREFIENGVPLVVYDDGRIFTKDRYIVIVRLGKKRVCHIKGKEMTQVIAKDGYKRVRLQNNGLRVNVLSHRIIAKAFLSNPNNLPCVNHKDENKLNNNVSNLEWCTVDYNNKYNGRYENIKHSTKKVIQKTLSGAVITIFPSIKDAALAVEGFSSNIGNVCHGRMKTAYGFVWSFEGDNR